MNFDPSIKLSNYPRYVTRRFRQEAINMLSEMEDNKLEVHLKPSEIEPTNKVRCVVNRNALWYSEFAFTKCAGFPSVALRRKRGDKYKSAGSIRQKLLKSLNRITTGDDGKLCGKNYSYDYDLRTLIFERLCDGYYKTIEGCADHPEGATLAVDEVREFFKVKTPVVVELNV